MPNTIILSDTRFNVVALDDQPITLDLMYQLIGCSTVERLPVKIGDKTFTAWFDEEGKFSALNKPNAVMMDYDDKVHDWLAGTVLFFSENDEGDILPLTDQEAAYFLSKVTQYYIATIPDWHGQNHLGHYPILYYSFDF